MDRKYKTFGAGRVASGRVDLATGALVFVHEDTRSDSSILPVSISHIYSSKIANEAGNYGKGFKLNLNQTLSSRAGDDTKWKYTDGNGDQHKFKEKYFYRDENGRKQFISGLKTGDIKIDQEGRLFEIATEREVFAEIKTRSGLRLHTRLKNFKGSEKIETREDEILQLEEEISSLERNREELLFSISTDEDVVAVAISMSESSILELSESTLEDRQRKYLLLKNKYEQITEEDSEEFAYLIKKKIEKITADFSKERSLSDLIQVETLLEQKRATLIRIKNQLPVNFVVDKDIVLGFNAPDMGGKLVSVFDSFDNQVSIIYENGRIERVVGSDDREIIFEYAGDSLITIIDCEDRKTKFEYEEGFLTRIIHSGGENYFFKYSSNGLLAEIIPPGGIGTKLLYDGSEMVNTIARKTYALNGMMDTLSEIDFDTAPFVQEDIQQISYDTNDRITTVEALTGESDLVNTTPTFVKQGIREIFHFNKDWEIVAEHHSIFRDENAVYVPTKVALYDFKKDDYEFEAERKKPNTLTDLEACTLIENFKISSADRTPESVELEYPSADYQWTFGEYENGKKIAEHNSNAIRTNYNESGAAQGRVEIAVRKEFAHDDNGNLIRETLFETQTIIEGENDPVCIQKTPQTMVYEYNKQGKPIRTIDSEGMVSETFYDAKGNATKSVTYHKSNPSAKFYTEQEIAENGQVKSNLNEFGERVESLEYMNGRDLVQTSKDSDSHKTSYGYDVYTNQLLGMAKSSDGEVNQTVYTYAGEQLTKLQSGNTTVEYTYDMWGRKQGIILNGEDYLSFEYPDAQTTLAKYANGDHFKTITDKFGKVQSVLRKAKQFNFWAVVARNDYDNEDRLIEIYDGITQENTTFTHDPDGNVSKTQQGEVSITSFESLDGDMQTLTYEIGEKEQIYTKNLESGEVVSFGLPTGDEVTIEKDGLGRLTKVVAPVVTEEYAYLQKGDHASSLVSRVTQKVGNTTKRTRYIYDTKGNITEVRDSFNRQLAEYEYDELNRLTKDGKTEFGYDNNGNILFKKTDDEVIAYEYEGDKLLSFNGEECGDYDALGNPEVYRNKALEWDFRSLKKFGDAEFKYNANGLRISKTHGDTHSKFHWAGDKLIAEKRTKSTCDLQLNGYIYEEGHYVYAEENFIEYIYGINGITGIKLNDTPYWFTKNLQGDVTAIYDNDGEYVAKYTYDAFGNHKIFAVEDGETVDITDNMSYNSIGHTNPIRYRGYYYDSDAGLYYLKSRYYDPHTGRFINADDISYIDSESLNGLNLYAYCLNNPIMNIDPIGCAPWWNWLISGLQIAVGAVLIATGVGAGLGAMLVVGGAVGMVTNALGSQIGNGAGSMLNGLGAVSTGVSLFSFGSVGIIAGIISIGIGVATMTFGANEVVAGITGTNYIEQWTGMNSATYGGLYLGLNIASSVVTIAGRLGMRAVGTIHERSAPIKSRPYSKNMSGKNTYYYDGKGNPYWSKHNIGMLNDGTPSGLHWHTSLGRDNNHIYNYLELIIRLIFGG